MDLDELRAFVVTVQERSVSAAARRLYRSQSAVTRQIQSVEREVGGPLLDRRARPLALTALGETVFAYAGKALTAVDELKGVVKTAGAEPAGELRVGISFSLARLFTRSPLVQFARQFPRVSLSITSDWSRHLLAAIRDSSIDAALLLLPSDWAPSEPMDVWRLGKEELVVIAPRAARLPRRGDLGALADARWVVSHEPCVCRAMLRQAVGRSMNVVAELNGATLHIDLVAAGLGMALVPTRMLRTHQARAAVRTLTEPRFARVMWFAVGRVAPVLKPAVDFLQVGIARALEARGGSATSGNGDRPARVAAASPPSAPL